MGLMHLDLRAFERGGPVAATVAIQDGAGGWVEPAEFRRAVQGRHLVLATHGFNVDADDGRVALAGWQQLAELPLPLLFVGVLWPGDSRFLPVLDYPVEGSVALQAAGLLADFLRAQAQGATALSFVSHSLGARLMLETARRLGPEQVHTLILMAGAIEDDCLSEEYADVAAAVQRIRVVASRRDLVLKLAFPLGNPVGELLMHGHPYFRQALGREGPQLAPRAVRDFELWQIPDAPSDWGYGHGDYMPGLPVPVGRPRTLAVPLRPPADTDAVPNADGFSKNEWAAAVITSQWP